MANNDQSAVRAVWLAIFIIAGIITAAATAWFLHEVHAHASTTMTAAGMAFVATVTFCVSAWNFLKP